jgi:hypothetical protein
VKVIKTLIIWGFVAALIVSLVGLYWSISALNIEHLIVCSTQDKAYFIPERACKFYFYNFTGRNEAENLESGAGLAYAFEIEQEKERREVLAHLMAIGVDVNAVSPVDGLTPLNAAILLNEPRLVNYLISKGADSSKKDKANRMNAMEFLDVLEDKPPGVDRSAVRSILKEYQH